MFTVEKVWDQVRAVLAQRVSQAHFRTWFARSTMREKSSGLYALQVPNAYAKDVVVQRYLPLITELVRDATNPSAGVVIEVDVIPKKTRRGVEQEPLFTIEVPAARREASPLRSDFTFTTFAVSTSNQLAHAAATAAAKMPGKAYNPLFLYGGVGVGKSHLMHAVGNTILQSTPNARVVYCMGEEFTNELIAAIQTKTTNRFKRKYRELDCLLIDDIQFIAGKTSVQEEFFHTFNAILRVGGQIILTSDRPPSDIQRMEERLVSRFEAGMIVDIQPPDFELRTAILLIKAENLGINLPMSCAQLIAESAPDIRKMQGILTSLTALAGLERVLITDELVLRILGARRKPGTPRIIPPKVVVEHVASYYNLKMAQLTGVKRDRVIVRPRQIAMYLLKNDLRLPLTEVGRILGGRDHTTIMHGVGLVEKLLHEGGGVAADIVGIRKRIWG